MRLSAFKCNVRKNITEDPFRSIGWQQPDLFQVLVGKTFGLGYSRENLSSLLLDACTGGLSRESLHIQNQLVLLAELQTSDVKYMAIEEAKKLVEERSVKLKGLGKYDSQSYYLQEAINNLCGMILLISIALAEPEDGVQYYFKNCKEHNSEIILYRALDLVDWMDEDELWIQVYQYGIQKKIKPRQSLVNEYTQRVSRNTETI